MRTERRAGRSFGGRDRLGVNDPINVSYGDSNLAARRLDSDLSNDVSRLGECYEQESTDYRCNGVYGPSCSS